MPLLGCILKGDAREQEIVMAWVRSNEAFYNNDCKDVWVAFKELYRDQIDIDFITYQIKYKK